MRLDNNTFKRLYENAHNVQSGVSEQVKLQEEFTAKAYALTEEFAEKLNALSKEYDLHEETHPSDPFVRQYGYKRRPIGDRRPAPGLFGNFVMGHTDREQTHYPEGFPPEGEMYDGSEEEVGPPTSPGGLIPPGFGRQVPAVIDDILDYLKNLMSNTSERRPVVNKGEPGGGGLAGLNMGQYKVTPGGGLDPV